MGAMILGLLGNWRLLTGAALAIIVTTGLIYVASLRASLQTAEARSVSLEDQLAQAQATNKANLAAIAELKADAAFSNAAVTSAASLAASRAADIETLRQEVTDARAHATPLPANCPAVHPALVTALDGLRRLSSAAPGAGSNPGGARGAP